MPTSTPPDPTPAEIARKCERIQESWSERERLRRAGIIDGEVPHWYPPGVVRSAGPGQPRCSRTESN